MSCLFFQQDVAPPRYALAARDYLNQAFQLGWFGRQLRFIFFFCGVGACVKNEVYENNAETINGLKDYVAHVFVEID